MCGIVGYIGKKRAVDVILTGLTHLEYRGYDSAGIALVSKDGAHIYKAAGKLNNLKEILSIQKPENISATAGIGHTRWATHGQPSEINAHPHTCNCGSLILVHNGIIENYKELKPELETKGCKFKSETDTEVAAHLIAHEFDKTKNLLKAVQNAIKKLKGAYAFSIMHKSEPDKIIAARKNAPLIIGLRLER